MTYVLKIHLSGFICAACKEALSNMTVRLYSSRTDQKVTALAAAQPKDTFRILSDEEIKYKASSLLAEGKTDGDGFVSFELGEKQGYNGEAVEVDVYCEAVPGQKTSGGPPRQFSITILQPAWRQSRDGFVAAWDHSISARQWCVVRGLFGAWVICGKVILCGTKQPIGGVRVLAFDRDWLQDDALGFAMTNGSGQFRIDYAASDFQTGTFLNIELFGGPDLYFRVEAAAGVPLLVEASSRGRDPDRENVGVCFCVELCVDAAAPPVQPDPLPVFTSIGGYDFVTQIDSAPPGSGLTVGDHRAFYSTLRLNGILSKKLNGNPMEYRFEVAPTDDQGNLIGGWSVVNVANVARTVIGTWEIYAPTGAFDPNPIKTRTYTVNGTVGPHEKVANVVSGWIQVPQENNVFTPDGFFQPNGNMINLISQSLASFGSVDLTGLVAGQSSMSTGKSLAQDKHFAIRMKVREVGTFGSGTVAGICQHVAIDNTLYDNLTHHPSWAGFTQSGALAVGLLDIQQLITNGCSEITNALDVLFTAAHPNLGAVTISMSGPGGPYGFVLPAAVAGERFGTATPDFIVSDLPHCAYIVGISVNVLLTTGDSSPLPLTDQIAFCKH